MADKSSAGLVTCVTCGKQYTVCRKCEQHKGTWQSWRMTACNMQCYEISNAIHDYYIGIITATEARDILLAQNYESLESTTENTAKWIAKIILDAEAANKAAKKTAKAALIDNTK